MKNTHLENFFELSSDLLCSMDQHGFFTLVNPAFYSVLGYSEEELKQKHYSHFVHPDDWEETRKEALSLLAGERANHYQNRYITKEGKIVWLSWNYNKIKDGCFYGAARNITQLKEAEQSLQTSENKFRTLVQN